MAVELFDLDLFIDRLSAEVDLVKGRVQGAAELADVLESGTLKSDKALFCIEANNRASPNATLNIVDQQSAVVFSVVTGVRHVGDKTGMASYRLIREVRKQVFDALLGWTPERTLYKPTEVVGGRVVNFVGGVLWWQDDFSTQMRFRKV